MANEMPGISIPDNPALMEQLEKALGHMKATVIRSINPEIWQKKINHINAANNDSDPAKLSKQEAMELVRKNVDDPAVLPELLPIMKMFKSAMDKTCSIAGTDTENGRQTKAALEQYGARNLTGIKFQVALAKSIEDGGKDTDELARKYSELLARDVSASVDSNPLSKGDKERVAKIFTDMIAESGETLKSMIQNNPALRKQLLTLPDVSELGNLSPDEACTAITGKGTGKII